MKGRVSCFASIALALVLAWHATPIRAQQFAPPTTDATPTYNAPILPPAPYVAQAIPTNFPSAAAPQVVPVAYQPAPPLTEDQVKKIVADYFATRDKVDPNKPVVVGADKSMKGAWNHGMELTSPNGEFRVHVGGQTQYDATWFNTDAAISPHAPFPPGGASTATVGQLNSPNLDSTNFRRARLRVDGQMYDNVEWVSLWEFANMVQVSNVAGAPPGTNDGPPSFLANQQAPAVSPTEVWVAVTKLPVVGNFRVGNFREPIGFEHLTSSRFLDFMERSYNQELFYGPFNNGFSPGAMFFNWTENERATWAAWVGPNQSNIFGYHLGDQWATTIRGSWLPYFDAEGRYLIHVGGSASYRAADQGQARLRARGDLRSGPPSFFNPNWVDTGSFNANTEALVNLEYAQVWGPLSISGEWCMEQINGVSPNPAATGAAALIPPTLSGNAFMNGGYIDAMYFLTGEHRAYNRKTGAFDRVVPFGNFFRVKGPNGRAIFNRGAWQVGVRESSVNLNSDGITGGSLSTTTLGVNWFLNPNLKFQWNYDYTHRGSIGPTPAGNISAFGTRMAFDF